MLDFLGNLFDSNKKQVEQLQPLVGEINRLEESTKSLPDDALRAKTDEFRERLSKGLALDTLLPEALAVAREGIRRTVGERAYDVQLIAAISLHQGKATEQRTGEGKTLGAALALYVNALEGRGAHLVTVNDYLARRDAGWYGQALDFLGLKVGCLVHEIAYLLDPSFTDESQSDPRLSHLRPVTRPEAYRADVTYGTNNEFGFDYLRDNMVRDVTEMAQTNPAGEFGAHHYAIVDEVDFILIDEARTPLIISAPREEAASKYYDFAQLVKKLVKTTDYEIDEKSRTVVLTELGLRKVERMLEIENIYETDFDAVRHIEQALKAGTIFHRDTDYIVQNNEVIIVDEFTGRLMPGRRYSEGLHQAIEAKEGVPIQQESQTLATISLQNYFRMYDKLAGMSGTILTEAEEFHRIYGLESIAIPTNQAMIRDDHADVIYKTASAKWRAIVAEIEDCQRRGQPVLVGTTSVEKNELLHSLLARRQIPHEVLNAKNHQREAEIVSQAGRVGAVTVATNMAGRGVDIVLGGKKSPAEVQSSKFKVQSEAWKEEHDRVIELGGLHVIGTERHEARRIDNQLRGRSGRQGDPGSSRFFLSLEDELMRIFGGDQVKALMDRFGMEEDMPLEHGMVSRSIAQAQKKVEGFNFDIRKRLVEYDDVVNVQRGIIYQLRRHILERDADWLKEQLLGYHPEVEEIWEARQKELKANWGEIVRAVSLPVVDLLWMEHIDTLDDLREGVGLRGYAQLDPLVEYKKEARTLFERLTTGIYDGITERLTRLEIREPGAVPVVGGGRSAGMPRRLILRHETSELGVADEARAVAAVRASQSGSKPEPFTRPVKVGRNDPCPCGAKRTDGRPVKYKNCHGKNL